MSDIDHVYTYADGSPIPIGTVTVTRVYDELEKSYTARDEKGERLYRICSEQGGTRSTKTVTTMIWLVVRLISGRMSAIITRKSMPFLKKSVLKDFRDVATQLGVYNDKFMNKTEMEYTFENGSVVTFIAIDSSEKLKGVKADIVWMNEATEYTADDRQQLAFRCKFMILDYNPNFSEYHWLNDVNSMPTTHHFITTYKDNPFLSKEQVDEIESLQTRNYQKWIQYGTGQRCLSEGRIFQNIQIINEYDWPKETYIGIDFGYGAKPSAIVKMAIVQTTLYIQELFYEKNADTHNIAHELNKHKGIVKVCDSANPLYIKMVEADMENGEKLEPVNKHGRNGAQARIGAIHSMSKCDIVIVSTKQFPSNNIQKEFAEYCYQEDANGNITNEPIGENDHCIDAARYIYMAKAPKKRRRGVTIR